MNKELRREKINYFTDLIAWQEGHKLVLKLYEVTKNFPKEETYALTDQLRRAVVSITSNIAEGFSRQSYKEKTQFYSMALGSITELQNQIIISKDIGYLPKSEFENIMNQSVIVHKITNGLIKASKKITKFS